MTFLKWFALWLFLALIIGGIIGRQAIKYYRLSRGGASIRGQVSARKSHDLFEYDFEANGRRYVGIGMADVGGGPSYSSTSIGDQVLVHYLPAEPEINCLGNPRRLYLNELSLVLLAIAVFPTLIVAVLAFRFRKVSPSA